MICNNEKNGRPPSLHWAHRWNINFVKDKGNHLFFRFWEYSIVRILSYIGTQYISRQICCPTPHFNKKIQKLIKFYIAIFCTLLYLRWCAGNGEYGRILRLGRGLSLIPRCGILTHIVEVERQRGSYIGQTFFFIGSGVGGNGCDGSEQVSAGRGDVWR